MKNSITILSLILTFVFQSIGDIHMSGTLSENVQFKDSEGKEYDTYELLEKGQYILLHMTSKG